MSNSLIDLLQNQLSEGMIEQMSKQLGGADKQKTAAAANGIISTLVGSLAQNASTPEGANSLANALDRDHDGSLLDSMMDFMGGNMNTAPQQSRALNGAGILKHVLGDRQSNAVNLISQMSGLESNQTGSLMSMIAPMVMSALGNQKRQQGLDVGGLVNLLSGARTQQKQMSDNPAMSLVNSFLDF